MRKMLDNNPRPITDYGRRHRRRLIDDHDYVNPFFVGLGWAIAIGLPVWAIIVEILR